MGRVVTETFTDPFYERTVQVIEILVIDMRAAGFPEALDLARDRLERLGWYEVGSTDVSVQMESSRWKGTTTTLGSVEDLDPLGAQLEPAADEALQAEPKRWATYVVVSLSSVGE
ncbi:unnamed protein product [[Actinomadura] parvosata subsp. kistnae]|uniref:Uncharacterized protein n=1 Tax=[Actinomadura] parvosata subsp. kistnae TaxID=1909395 RepID=A0A1V0ACF3_9ACTN|nr:hypothetical protein BKM31_46365 [Nonomuraea sp. ATCC 55076]SPL93749.1 unnamed protein product [Actinomadura parvosata subsp. kistnae]